MANHTGDAIEAVLAYFADLQISDDWRFNGETFEERVEGYVLSAIESLEEELESTEDGNQSESATPPDGREQAETRLEDASRDSARRDLSELLSEGSDPHEACCMVIYELLHVDTDVVAGDYVDSFLDWVFEGDAAERERWRAMICETVRANRKEIP